jgi:hypothetical protein
MIDAKPPAGLRAATRRWWIETTSAWELDLHHLQLLELAARELDRSAEARQMIKKTGGAVIYDRFNQLKENPWRKVERESRVTFARLLREIGLDVAEAGPPRAPTLARNGGYRNSAKRTNGPRRRGTRSVNDMDFESIFGLITGRIFRDSPPGYLISRPWGSVAELLEDYPNWRRSFLDDQLVQDFTEGSGNPPWVERVYQEQVGVPLDDIGL